MISGRSPFLGLIKQWSPLPLTRRTLYPCPVARHRGPSGRRWHKSPAPPPQPVPAHHRMLVPYNSCCTRIPIGLGDHHGPCCLILASRGSATRYCLADLTCVRKLSSARNVVAFSFYLMSNLTDGMQATTFSFRIFSHPPSAAISCEQKSRSLTQSEFRVPGMQGEIQIAQSYVISFPNDIHPAYQKTLATVHIQCRRAS